MAQLSLKDIQDGKKPETPANRWARPPQDRTAGHLANIDLQEFVRILLRRKWLILSSVAFFGILSALIAFQLSPLYRGKVLLMLDTRQAKVLDVQSVVSGLPAEAAVVRTEMDIITSSALAGRVVDRLKLMEHKEFESVDADASPIGRFFASVKTFIAGGLSGQWFGSKATEDGSDILVQPSPEEEQAAKRDIVIATLLERVRVSNAPQSYTITLEASAKDPKTAAAIANAFADEYLVDQLEVKFEKTSQATTWLSQRLDGLREKVQQAERAADAYRASQDLIKTGQSTVSGQQLAELNTQLVLARTERAQAEARLRAAQESIRSPERLAVVADVLASPLIQRLREQESAVRRREAELSSRYGPQHPTIINNRAELRDLQAKISEEAGKVIQGLANQVNIARAKERSLTDSLADLERKSATNLRAEVQLRELEREAEASRTLYEHFLSRFKETSEQQGMQQSDARVISRAPVPTEPYFPRKPLMIAGGALFGLLFGVLLAYLVERFLRGLYDLDQVEATTGYPGLGVVPKLRGFRAAPPHIHVLEKPESVFSESLRTVRTGIRFANVDNPPKVVMVTSALPSEGKTSFCLALARLTAKAGNKVLLVDCDLRRTGVARIMGADGPDLYDIATPETDWASIVQLDEKSGLHYVVSHGKIPNPLDFLESKRMETFISRAAQDYDLVILDTPPLRAVTDAAPLARLADVSIFLVRWAETPRELVALALKQLASYGAKIAGVVLTQVDMDKYAKYGENYRAYNSYYR